MTRLAIFASGTGSNAQRTIEYFRGHQTILVEMVLCNNPGAPVVARAQQFGIRTKVFSRRDFYETGEIASLLRSNRIDCLVLAGFLWLIPESLLAIYPGRIINIHPALLPKYGGKGMYGLKVHEAVIAAGETESGISIHLVNENYDEGKIIFQAKCPVAAGETPESLAIKIHELEHLYFPEVIERVVTSERLLQSGPH
jgi:phosphoribosylglycinamide formyltransferase 1